MKEKLELVKFNLTPIMTRELIKFNTLKKELINLKQKKILSKDELMKIQELESGLSKARIRFIKNFRQNNKEEINKYLKIKDQI